MISKLSVPDVRKFQKPQQAGPYDERYYDESIFGEKGFLIQNETIGRFQPVGITWNDSYCRRITDSGPSGCFIERDLSTIPGFDVQGYNCSGKGSEG